MKHFFEQSQVKGKPGLEITPEKYDLLQRVNEWLQNDENAVSETRFRTEADEDYKFYAGVQDTTEVLSTLAEQNRPSTVYNEIKPKVDMLIGMAAQSKREPTLVPVGAEDEAMTEIANGALIYHRNFSKVSGKEMSAFEHSIKSGRSFLYPRVGGDNPFEPEIEVHLLRGRDVVLDADSVEYDLSDARRIFLSRWFDEDDIKAKYPNFPAAEIMSLSQNQLGLMPTFFNVANEKYRLVECWYRKFVNMVWFINPITKVPDSLSEKDWAAFKKQILNGIDLPNGQHYQSDTIPEYQVRPARKVFYAIFSGNYLIEEGPSPFNHNRLPLVLVGAYKDEDENRWFGVISMAKDPQRGLNVTRRQLVHLLQTAPKGILAFETGAILNIEEYEERSSEPNFYLEIQKGMMEKWKFTDQPSISPIYSNLDALFTQSIKNLIGTQDALLGIQTSSREPGVTQEKRIETGIAVLYTLFKNFMDSRALLAELMFSLIQQYDTTERILRIEGPEGMKLLQINSQINPQNQGFNDVSFGKYDVRVDEKVENATMRNSILAMLTTFGQNNPGTIPPDLLMEYSDLPYSAKMRVREFNAQQAQLAEQARQDELALEEKKINMKAMVDMAKIKVAQEGQKNQAKSSVAKPVKKTK